MKIFLEWPVYGKHNLSINSEGNVAIRHEEKIKLENEPAKSKHKKRPSFAQSYMDTKMMVWILKKNFQNLSGWGSASNDSFEGL